MFKAKERIEFGSMPTFTEDSEDNDSDDSDSEDNSCNSVVGYDEKLLDNSESILTSMQKHSIDKTNKLNLEIKLNQHKIDETTNLSTIDSASTDSENVDDDIEVQILHSFEEEQDICTIELRREVIKYIDGYDSYFVIHETSMKSVVDSCCVILKRRFGNVNHKKHIIESIILRHMKKLIIQPAVLLS